MSEQRRACLEPTAARGRRRRKEGGREADACDSVGAVMRVPATEKQSVRPEHTAHSRTHAQNSEGVMGWQRPGASLTDTHTHIQHTLQGE